MQKHLSDHRVTRLYTQPSSSTVIDMLSYEYTKMKLRTQLCYR